MSLSSTWVLGALKEDLAPFQNTAQHHNVCIACNDSTYSIDREGFLIKEGHSHAKGWSEKLHPLAEKPCHPYKLNIIHLAQSHKMARPTTRIELQQNLPISTPLGGCPGHTTVMLYNHLGEQHTLHLLWKKIAPFVWTLIPVCNHAKSIVKQSGERVDLDPFVICFNIEGAPISFDGGHASPIIHIEWSDGRKTPLSLDLGNTLDFGGLTTRGDTLSYMAYSDGHEGQYRLEDIEYLNISEDGKCCLHLNDGTHFTIAHLAITGSH